MTSATLSAKKKTKHSDFISICLWSLKKHKVLPIVYASLLLFSSPVISLLVSLSVGSLNNPVAMLTFAVLSTTVTMIMTFIIAVMMFDYLHNKRKADVFGSLPCTRRTLFFARYTTGLLMIIVPYLLNMLIVALMSLGVTYTASGFMVVGATHSISLIPSVLQTGALVIISVIAAYSFTAFIAVCCGTTANTVLTTLLINLSYPLAISMLSILGSSMIPGVNLHIDEIPLISNLLSPYGSASGGIMTLLFSDLSGSEYSFFVNNWQQLIAWAILIAASIVGCFFLTRIRKTESAQNSFSFKAPSIIIRAIATAAIGLLVGLMFTFVAYFSTISDDYGSGSAAPNPNIGWTIFALFLISFFISAFLTHLIATVIFNKGFKGFAKSLISFAAVVLCVCLLYTSLAFGGFGADKYLPQSSEVSSVEITRSDSIIGGFTGSLVTQAAKQLGGGAYSEYLTNGDETIICDSEESISAAIKLHEKIINNFNAVNPTPYFISAFGEPNPYYSYSYEDYYDEDYYSGSDAYDMNPSSLKFVYNMNNGTTVERTYSQGYYGNIYMTSELDNIEVIAAKGNSDKLMSLLSGKNGEITSFNILSDWYGADHSVLNSKRLVDEMKKAMLDDMKNNTSENNNIFCRMIVNYRENGDSKEWQTNAVVPYSYKNSVKLLSQYGYTTSLNLFQENGTQTGMNITNMNLYFIDGKTGAMSEEAIDQFFTLPDNISNDYLKGRTTVRTGGAHSSINYDMSYFNADEETGEEVVEKITDSKKLSFKVVYTDNDGNMYYYDDKCLFDDLYHSGYSEITLYELTDNKDEYKTYYPFAIQAYSDEEKIYTMPANISERTEGYACQCVSANSISTVNGTQYVFLTAG